MLEMEPLFVSILGAPASGKSYFLTAMTWQLRRTLPTPFQDGLHRRRSGVEPVR